METDEGPKWGGKRPGAGRKPESYGLVPLRRTLRRLTTGRLDGRTVLARQIARWKDTVRQDRGGDLTAAQEAILENAAQKLIIPETALATTSRSRRVS